MGKLEADYDQCKACGELITVSNPARDCGAIECVREGCRSCMPEGFCEDHGPEHAEPDRFHE